MGSSLIRGVFALLALAGIAIATAPVADAAKREGSTYFMVGYDYHEGKTTEFGNGSTITTGNEGDFSFGFGYNFDKHMAIEFTMSFPTVDYEADIQFSDNGGPLQRNVTTGEFDFSMLRLNGFYNFGDGPLSPFISGGIGYTTFDSNIVAPFSSDTICWWDPWYGYYCGYYQSTYGGDEWTYNASAGLMLEMKGGWFSRLSYNTEWVNYDGANGTPSYDFIRLDFGMRY